MNLVKLSEPDSSANHTRNVMISNDAAQNPGLCSTYIGLCTVQCINSANVCLVELVEMISSLLKSSEVFDESSLTSFYKSSGQVIISSDSTEICSYQARVFYGMMGW